MRAVRKIWQIGWATPIMGLFVLSLLQGCTPKIITEVHVECGTGGGGPPTDGGGPGRQCLKDPIQLNAQAPPDVIPINPLPGQPASLPPNPTCAYPGPNGNSKCHTPGAPCTYPSTCKDTWDMQTQQCDCTCM
jgi:hypothetical protein